MPVGTQGAVKGVTHRDLEAAGAEILLSNTYHLYLRPGDDLIARRGGLHRFIGWTTDPHRQRRLSGVQPRRAPDHRRGGRAFQVASRRLLASAHAGEGDRHPGAARLGHRDGARRVPRLSRRVETRAFDGAHAALGSAGARPACWRCGPDRSPASRCPTPGQAQFGIVQGGLFPALREESAARTVAIGFEGYAIGGLSVGEPIDVMYAIVARTTPLLPTIARAI